MKRTMVIIFMMNLFCLNLEAKSAKPIYSQVWIETRMTATAMTLGKPIDAPYAGKVRIFGHSLLYEGVLPVPKNISIRCVVVIKTTDYSTLTNTAGIKEFIPTETHKKKAWTRMPLK